MEVSMFAQHDNMTLSIEELKTIVKNLRKDGLNSQQIADELSLSQDTIQWLLTDSTSERPTDVRVDGNHRCSTCSHYCHWRNHGRCCHRRGRNRGHCGRYLNQWNCFAHEVAQSLDVEVAIHRNVDGEPGAGALSNKYGQVGGARKSSSLTMFCRAASQ